MNLACIIPLGPNETLPLSLINTLHRHDVPIIVSATETSPPAMPHHVLWIQGPAGRPQQLNRAIQHSSADWLWLVHSDCGFDIEAPPIIRAFCAAATWQSIGHGRLRFAGDGPAWVRLNAWGANLRSRWCKQPYGDQALCIHRRLWNRLVGFCEHLDRGEDLDFVIRARAVGAQCQRLPFTVTTSARRYQSRGWLKTTVEHQIRAWQLIRSAKQWRP